MLSIIFCSLSLSAQNTFPSSGNVGIATASPSESLDVNGNIRSNRLRTGSAVFKSNSVSSFNSFNTGSDPSLSTGWIAADFGGSDNASSRLVIGTGFGGKAVIGTHNGTLTDWGGQILIAPMGGNVAIGTTNANYKLDVGGTGNFAGQSWFSHGNNNMSGYSWANAALTTNSIEIVNNNAMVSNSSPTLAFHRYGSGGPQFRLSADGSNVLYLESSGVNSARSPVAYGGGPNSYFSRLHVDGSLTMTGNVGIGINNPAERLAVNGIIRSKEVKVEASGWPDYVFAKSYSLPSLQEVKAYIDQNHHLPEIPSEKEITEKGLSLGEMNMLLMKKVEELTLYLIEKDKREHQQQQEINQLKGQVGVLIGRLN